ncbi:hypothetical protein ACFQ1M_11010 [Sungkyunkwania multivorans]|uniref:Uncharacterized protein n=1 Tax=Sungkyunkwania multivorans TaxID=1173618 RepID=A0ABW3CZG6_9FLAO
MKHPIRITFLFIVFSSITIAQSNLPNGIWYGGEGAFSYGNANGVYIFQDGMIYRAGLMKDKGRYDIWTKNDENTAKYNFKEASLTNNNNSSHTWINTCDGCPWTETQTGNFFYHGNPYILEYSWKRSVNNNKSQDCFDENENCFTKNAKGFARLVPIYIKRDVPVGGKGSNTVELYELRVTDQTTELTLKFNQSDLGGTLHPPGGEKAYKIIDNTGKEYKLLAQYGWNGDGSMGFGYQKKILASTYVILFFEKIDITTVKNFNLKEGNCSERCWNFYDIRIE